MEYNYDKCPECGYVNNSRPDTCPVCGFDLASHRSILYRKQTEEFLEQQAIALEQQEKAEKAAQTAQAERSEAARARLTPIRKKLQEVSGMISASNYTIVGLKSDGTVVATGNNDHGLCNVTEWKDILAVKASNSFTIALKDDGTVVGAADNPARLRGADKWENIISIETGWTCGAGLQANGGVLHTWSGPLDWTDIVAIGVEGGNVVGVKSDGTVVVEQDKKHVLFDVSEWTDMVAADITSYFVVGLKSDGTVMIDNGYGDVFDVSEWTDIVTISAASHHVVGLKADGTVVIDDRGYNKFDVSEWTDIVAISTSSNYVVGLKADGTVVVATEYGNDGNYDVSAWRLFNNIENLEAEKCAAWKKRKEDEARQAEELRIAKEKQAEELRIAQERQAEELRIEKEKQEEARRIAEEKKRIILQRRQAGLCQHCGGTLKGLFTKKCVSCGKTKDY